jgi:uncharacterized protein YkwD
MKILIKFFLFLALFVSTNACKKEESNDSVKYTDPSAPVLMDDVYPPTPDGNNHSNNSTTLSYTEEFMKLVNDHRESIGVQALSLDSELNSIVQTHTDKMADGSVAFGHTGFSSRCTSARAALGGGNWCGENVAMGQKTPEAVFNAWMNSPGHRANIEQVRASHTGIAYKISNSGTYYWTQIFIEY